jgi:hypothetical protein
MTISNRGSLLPGSGLPRPPLSQSVPHLVRTSANSWPAATATPAAVSRPGLSCGDGRQGMPTPVPGHHTGNRSSRNAATTATLVARHGNVPRKGGGRRRGGERRPRARSGPGGGGRLRPYRKLIRKVPSYATTGTGFPAAGGVSATGARCSVSPKELQHMRKGLRRASR